MFEKIICPYCFGEPFSHEDVLFRASSYFDVGQLDKTGNGRNMNQLESMDDSIEKTELINEYKLREKFMLSEDEKYNSWWANYGGTSEEYEEGDVPPYKRPIIRPRVNGVSELSYDNDGFARAVKDPWGVETRDRVCPHCHNPLPSRYGKYPVRYISVIGISGAGKTVFLSKLIECIKRYSARLGLPVEPAKSSRIFVDNNLIEERKPLPVPTQKVYFNQPLFYNLKYGDNYATFVIYDIAGETCVSPTDILKYGNFIKQSNGIMLMIDPKELGFGEGIRQHQLDSVITSIHSLMDEDEISIPIAVCISKSDTIRKAMPDECFEDVVVNKKMFSTKDYNKISEKLSKFFEKRSEATKPILNNFFKTYNFFAITTLNGPVETMMIQDEDGFEVEASVPVQPPNPKRIEEPLYWLFMNFGYIKSDGKIYTPRNEELIEEREELEEKINKLQSFIDNTSWGIWKRKIVEGRTKNDYVSELHSYELKRDEIKRKISENEQ